MAKKKTAIVSIRVVSDANIRGFKKAAAASQSMVKQFTKMTAITTSIASGAAIAGGAIGQVAAGAAALGAAAGPALGAVMLGMDGIKEAATAAQEPFNSLKESVSGEFAAALEGPFSRLGDLLTNLTPAMSSLAATTGDVFGGMLDTISANSAQLEALTRGSQDFIAALGPGLNSLIDGFLSIGSVMEDTGALLGESFGGILDTIGQKFAEFSDNGTMKALIEGISQALDGLSNLLGPLLDLLAQLGVALGPAFGDILTALGVAVEGLVGPFSQIAEVAGTALADAMAILAPAIGPVAQAIADLTAAVAPLLAPLAEVVATLGTALAEAISAAAPMIQQVAELFGDVLLMALDAIRPLFPVIVDAITVLAESFQPLIPVLRQTAEDLFPVFQDVLRQVSPLLPEMAGLVGQLIQALIPMIPPLADIAKTLFPALAQIVQALFPILQTLVSVLVTVLQAITPILEPVGEIINSLMPVLIDLVNALTPILQFLLRVIGEVASLIAGAFVSCMRDICGWFDTLIGWIDTAIGWLQDFADWVDSIPVPDFGDAFGANPWGGDVSAEFMGASGARIIAGIPAKSAPTTPAPTVINITFDNSVIGDERHLADVVTRAIRKTETNLGRRQVFA